MLYVGARFGTCFACLPRYVAQFRGRLLGPRDFSLPLAGVTAHVRPAARPPPGGHSPASHAGDAPGGTQPGAEHVRGAMRVMSGWAGGGACVACV